MRESSTALLLSLALALPAPLSAQAESAAADLATGIRQVDEGDLEAAVITLDGVVRRLSAEKGKEKELSQAHLYLGIAHLGLGQSERAKAEMSAAWRSNKDLKLDPKNFPPRVMQLYEQARREARETEDREAGKRPGAAASPTSPPPGQTSRPPSTPESGNTGQKKGGSKLPLILLGGAVVAGGIAAAAASGGKSTPAATLPPVCSQGQFTAANLRYEPNQFACPAGHNVYPVRYVVDLSNNSPVSVSMTSVTTESGTCDASAGFNCFINPSTPTYSPVTVGAGVRTTLVATDSYTCDNNTTRFGFLRTIANLRIVTSCGTFVLTPATPFTTTFN